MSRAKGFDTLGHHLRNKVLDECTFKIIYLVENLVVVMLPTILLAMHRATNLHDPFGLSSKIAENSLAG